MATAEHREPCESRGSRTVLGAPGGEIPPGDSTEADISRPVIATSISSDFHQGIGEPFWLIEHHDVVGVYLESVPRWVSLALRQRLIEGGIRKLGGTNVSLFRHLLTRTREPDRLRIRPYRLRRQLRVDIATVFFIDEDGRQLRRWDEKTRLALFRGIQEGLAETLVGEVDRLLTVLRFIGIEPDYRRNAIADLLKSARAHPASIGMYHQANIVEILPFDNVDDVGDMGVEIYVLVQQMRTLAEPGQGR